VEKILWFGWSEYLDDCGPHRMPYMANSNHLEREAHAWFGIILPSAMRKTTLFAVLALLAAGLFGQSGPSGLTGRCKNDGTYPSCVGGEIIFTGSSYPAQDHITVKNGSAEEIDDGDYTTNSGILSFTENLSFADTYTIFVSHVAVLTVATN
jgi:hypothetical protein